MITSTGFALNFHYCFDNITSVTINKPASNCIMETAGKMKCCHDRHFEVKVKDVHQVKPETTVAKITGFKCPVSCFGYFSSTVPATAVQYLCGKDPPGILPDSKTLFIKNRVFRI